MINPLIKAQLKNCRVAKIPEFDDNTTTLYIPKGTELHVTPYQVGKCYLIELADYIINPPPEFNLHDNWNQGRVPHYKHYKCEIKALQGKMVQILGCGYDLMADTDANSVWQGWLPQKSITILQELR